MKICISTVLALGLTHVCMGQVITSWTAPSSDDGNPVSNFVPSWSCNPSTGAITNLPSLSQSRALAADNTLGRLYQSGGSSLQTHGMNADGSLFMISPWITVKTAAGVSAVSRQIESMGFANGLLYASVFRSTADETNGRGLPRGLWTIDPQTAVATVIPAAAALPVLKGMDYNPDDGFMYAVIGPNGAQSIIRFDLKSFDPTVVVVIPPSVYAGVTGVPFDGVAVGEGKVFLTTGLNTLYGNIPIGVLNLATGTFETGLPAPRKVAENSYYAGGATYFRPFELVCAADINNDGMVSGDDLATLMSDWGASGSADLDASGVVDAGDLTVLLSAWGACP